jgi:hypothetical protein
MPTTRARAAVTRKASSKGTEKEEDDSNNTSILSHASSVSDTTALSQRPKLAFYIQKQLAIDIEANGGLDSLGHQQAKPFQVCSTRTLPSTENVVIHSEKYCDVSSALGGLLKIKTSTPLKS